ncbi:MAG: undecaprenyldiphospho-muramoylpentapeptide beta-N-acetylglucosaminyltransferase [Finegoldia sp.]|nr:undecaprenyldiphospho-muramoylpentapeptide beta-N-acetylglucosaminyltransferase [Finegoldia sp.]
MRFIISGGGTGGHIYPAISVIEELKSRDADCKILYVGTKNGLESDIVPKLGIDFRSIHVRGIPRKLSIDTFRSANELQKGLREAKKIIREFKPDLVFGTGGFVTGPVLYQAHRLKIKTAFHEQNSYPGMANRIISNFADRYFVTFGNSIKYFKNKDRAIITGNPLRKSFKNIDENKDDNYKIYNIDKTKKVVFAVGGSNGSYSLNQVILGMNNMVKNQDKFEIILATGKNYFDQVKKDLGDISNIHIYPYIDEIDKVYSISDLIITSSGAITLSELSYLGKASILIPKSYTTENHQVHNAKSFEDQGAAVMILEDDLNSDSLFKTISEIIEDDKKLKSLSENSKKLSAPNAALDIVDGLYGLLNNE